MREEMRAAEEKIAEMHKVSHPSSYTLHPPPSTLHNRTPNPLPHPHTSEIQPRIG